MPIKRPLIHSVHCDPDIILKSPEFMRRTKAWIIRDGAARVRKRLADIGVPANGIKQILAAAQQS